MVAVIKTNPSGTIFVLFASNSRIQRDSLSLK
jgi:hypothetical protein